jgi:hypothetical protein
MRRKNLASRRLFTLKEKMKYGITVHTKHQTLYLACCYLQTAVTVPDIRPPGHLTVHI